MIQMLNSSRCHFWGDASSASAGGVSLEPGGHLLRRLTSRYKKCMAASQQNILETGRTIKQNTFVGSITISPVWVFDYQAYGDIMRYH